MPSESGGNNLTIAAAAIQQELWISFGSLLRSYAAAVWQGFPDRQFAVEAQESAVLVIQLGSNRLEVVYQQEHGTGTWNLNGKNCGTFALTAEGRVSLDQAVPVEMDSAAEVLAGKLI